MSLDSGSKRYFARYSSAGKGGGGDNDAQACKLNFITMQNKITVKPVLSRHCIEQPLKAHIRPVKDIL